MKTCDVCRSEFEPKTSRQLRCSRKCGSVASNSRRRTDISRKRCRTCTQDLPVARFVLANRSCIDCEALRSSGLKKCNACADIKPRTDFHRHTGRQEDRESTCKACKSARSQLRNATSEAREANREIKYRARYGIGAADVMAMYEHQGGKCAICRKESTSSMLHVDHDHETGVIRGLLCRGCNVLLGHCSESIETLTSAIAYIERHRQ